MAVPNPFRITYGALAVGGTDNNYLLHEPYEIEKTFETIRVSFTVVITTTSYTSLQSLSDALEDAYRLRDQNLTIEVDYVANPTAGASWSYVFGTDILNTRATLRKTANPETDRGHSRAYRCEITGELPAGAVNVNVGGTNESVNGLRDFNLAVSLAASRQRTVTMQGVYTPHSGNNAAEEYLANFDGEATTILALVDATATWELIDENYNQDRVDHTCNFTRTYVELLVNQSIASLDDVTIRDHRIVFTDISQHTGDALENIYRLRRVSAVYSCAVDIDQSLDLQTTFTDTIRPHLKALFQTSFSPLQFAVEESRVTYEEATNRITGQMTFVYQPAGGGVTLEVQASATESEQTVIDYTATHSGGQFDFYADPGWTIRRRIWESVTSTIGGQSPPNLPDGSTAMMDPRREGGVTSRSLASTAAGSSGGSGGAAPLPGSRQDRARGGRDTGELPGLPGAGSIREGFNTISRIRRFSTLWIGDPNDDQIEVTIATDSVTQQYHNRPGGPRIRWGGDWQESPRSP